MTSRLVSMAGLMPGAKVLDIGCGQGDTVLHLRSAYGYDAAGIDCATGPGQATGLIREGRGEEIPFPGGSMDGILMECSFSLMEDPDRVLQECRRVLKPTGKLLLADLYARGEPVVLAGQLGRLDTKETVLSRLEDHGFRVTSFGDATHALQTLMGQMILDHGADAFYGGLGVTPGLMKTVKGGYFLAVAERGAEG